MVSQNVKNQLDYVPEKPGIYLLKDNSGTVIYVGKSSNLKNRVRSYFVKRNNDDFKSRKLYETVEDLEFVVTDTETEALILENNFIKHLMPRYNSALKDSKTYPYIKIETTEDFPQVHITRKIHNDGARYFGPYAGPGSVRKTMDLLKRLFPYRSCTKEITGNDERPCLEYYINRCIGPCVDISLKNEYDQIIEQVIMILEGKAKGVVRDLERAMTEASNKLRFEKASVLRDQIKAIKRFSESQKIVSISQEDQDVIAMAKSNDHSLIEVFFVRAGKLVSREHFVMTGTKYDSPPQILESFVKQYYESSSNAPKSILIEHKLEEEKLVTKWMSEKFKKKITITVPLKGPKLNLVQMAAENAAKELLRTKAISLLKPDLLESAIDDLQKYLNLRVAPKIIECYDISNIQGTTPVGSMVVFENGVPQKSSYRRFSIKNVTGPDDYSMMQEMLRRRFKRIILNADSSKQSSALPTNKISADKWQKPDLIIIDGGKGHLNSVLQVMLELGINDLPIASLAKENEEIFTPETSEPIMLPRQSNALFLVQRIRDEAHRFAITYHRKLRNKKTTTSKLDLVPGIGAKRRKSLISHFGSVEKIKLADVEEIATLKGITRELAVNLKDILKK